MAKSIDSINTLLDAIINDPASLTAMGNNENAPEYKLVQHLKAKQANIEANGGVAKEQKAERFVSEVQNMKAQLNSAYANKPDSTKEDAENSTAVVNATLQGAFSGMMNGDILGGLMTGLKAALGSFVFGIGAVKDFMMQMGEYANQNWFQGKATTFEQAGINIQDRKVADRIVASTGVPEEALIPMLQATVVAPPVPQQQMSDELKNKLQAAGSALNNNKLTVTGLDDNKDGKLSLNELHLEGDSNKVKLAEFQKFAQQAGISFDSSSNVFTVNNVQSIPTVINAAATAK